MKSFALFLSASTLTSGAALSRRQNNYGWKFSNALSTGPVASNSFIREATTTLILPKTNNPQTGNLALWPGMGTSDGDLIQGLAISVSDTSAGCAKSSGKWCIIASTLETTQKMGKAVPADPGSKVTFHYKYNDATKKYDQTVALNGVVVSSLSTDSGKAQGWGTAVECQQAACGTAPAHQYINTKLVMDVADPRYDRTKGVTGATGNMVTKDGGKTWTIDTISIQSYTYT